MNKDMIESLCLDVVLHSGKCLYLPNRCPILFDASYVKTERPDFLFGKIDNEHFHVGIEHFLVDVLFDGNVIKNEDGVIRNLNKKGHSISRMDFGKIDKKIQCYQNNLELLDKDIQSGITLNFVEGLVNRQLDKLNGFSYAAFLCNFWNVFYGHWKSIDVYRKSCDKFGFLIEFRVPLRNDYLIFDGDRCRRQVLNGIPITRDMIVILSLAVSKLDFVIFSMLPMFYSGNGKVEHKYDGCRVIYADVANLEADLRGQSVCICDAFGF